VHTKTPVFLKIDVIIDNTNFPAFTSYRTSNANSIQGKYLAKVYKSTTGLLYEVLVVCGRNRRKVFSVLVFE